MNRWSVWTTLYTGAAHFIKMGCRFAQEHLFGLLYVDSEGKALDLMVVNWEGWGFDLRCVSESYCAVITCLVSSAVNAAACGRMCCPDMHTLTRTTHLSVERRSDL